MTMGIRSQYLLRHPFELHGKTATDFAIVVCNTINLDFFCGAEPFVSDIRDKKKTRAALVLFKSNQVLASRLVCHCASLRIEPASITLARALQIRLAKTKTAIKILKLLNDWS
jgi:hypothetical protein